MTDVVDHHAEALQRAHAKQTEIAPLGENHLINSFKTLRGQDRVANLSFDHLLRGRHEGPLAARPDPDGSHLLGRQPAQFRACVNQGLNGGKPEPRPSDSGPRH